MLDFQAGLFQQSRSQRLICIHYIEGWRLREQMGDPNFVELRVWKGDHRVSVWTYSLGFECKSYHSYSLSCRERVFHCMAMLCTTDDDDELIDLFENMLHSFQMTQVKGLEAPHVEASLQVLFTERIPNTSGRDLVSFDGYFFPLQELTLDQGSSLVQSSAH